MQRRLQFVVTPATGLSFIAALPVRKFHGVGPVTADKMNRLEIFTGADLALQSLSYLKQHFGKAGPWYYSIARGDDDRAVTPHRLHKSSGSETTFSNDLTDPAAIEAGVTAMADEVWAWCEKAQSFGRTVTVKIKYADFRKAKRSRTLHSKLTSKEALRDISIGLVRSVFPPEIGIHLLGVTMSGFERNKEQTTAQLDLDI